MTRPSTTLSWTDIHGPTDSHGFGNYDFSEEVNVEVLGHLFERSITELEKLRVGGLFALKASIEGANGNGASQGRQAQGQTAPRHTDDDPALSKMPKSASASDSASTIRPRPSPA